MSDSMIRHFRDLLEEGEPLSDPFADAVERAREDLSEEEKEALRVAWNNRIAQHYGGDAKLVEEMHRRRARRVLKHRCR